MDYDLGDRLRVRITADEGHLWLQLKNLDKGDSYAIDYDVDDDAGYFKVGCYLQSSITYCEEKIRMKMNVQMINQMPKVW